MVLEIVKGINLLQFIHCQKQNLGMIPYVFSKFQRSNWEELCNLIEIESCKRLVEDMANFQTLQTQIGHSATRYHYLTTLSHMSSHILSEICLGLGYLQWTTTCYSHFLKNIDIFQSIFQKAKAVYGIIVNGHIQIYYLKKAYQILVF